MRGGSLILTPLLGADGQIYAMAQGNLAVGGLGAEGADGSKIVVNIPSTGRIPEGATVERAVATGFDDRADADLQPRSAPISPPRRTSRARSTSSSASAPRRRSTRVSVAVRAPPGADVRATLMSTIENLDVVSAEPPAKVIVNARTGTVVINSAVRVGPAAVTHGKLTVRIDENQRISQPAPFSQGQTAVEQRSGVAVEEEKKPDVPARPRPQARRHRQGGERDRRVAGRSGRDPRGAEGSRRAQGGADRPVTDDPAIPRRDPATGIATDTSRARRRKDNLEKAGEQFEAVFTGMMLKSMRQAKLADPLFDSKALDTFRDMQDQKVVAGDGASTRRSASARR